MKVSRSTTLVPDSRRRPALIRRGYVRMQNGEIWVETYTTWKGYKHILSFEPHWCNILPVETRGNGLVPMREEE